MDAALVIKGVVDTVARGIDKLSDMPRVAGAKWVAAPEGEVFGNWLYDGKTFTAPPVQIKPVPISVTMRQARIALSRAGVLKAANDAIEAMEGQPGEEARIEWDYAAELRRDHPLVAGLGQSLGLDDEAIDNLFREAQTL